MKKIVERYPALFSMPENAGEVPSLNGRYCKGCGYVMFPPQDYGCDRCGAGPELLEPKTLAGVGTLKRYTTVFHQNKPSFVMGSIQLEGGPPIEALLDKKEDAGLQPGLPVEAVLVENGENKEGDTVLDYCFKVREG